MQSQSKNAIAKEIEADVQIGIDTLNNVLDLAMDLLLSKDADTTADLRLLLDAVREAIQDKLAPLAWRVSAYRAIAEPSSPLRVE